MLTGIIHVFAEKKIFLHKKILNVEGIGKRNPT